MNQTAEILQHEIHRRDVRNRATLVSLSVRLWKAQKYDKRASAKVATDNHASNEAGRYNKRLIDVTEYLKPIEQTANAMRSAHYLYTLPWLDNGQRILPIKHYEAYCGRMNDLHDAFTRKVDDFIAIYPAAKQQARAWLGDLYDEADYPLADALRDKFQAEYYMQPLPSAEDFRVDITEADLEKAADKIDLAIKQGQAEAWRRLVECVEKIAERCKAYGSESRTQLRDSVVTNLIEVADLIPGLNLMENPELDRLASDARRLGEHDARELRENEQTREAVAREADELLAKMRFSMQGEA